MKGFIFLEVHAYLGMKGPTFCSVEGYMNILKLLFSIIPSPTMQPSIYLLMKSSMYLENSWTWELITVSFSEISLDDI